MGLWLIGSALLAAAPVQDDGPRPLLNTVGYDVGSALYHKVFANIEYQRALSQRVSFFVALGGWPHPWSAPASVGWDALLQVGGRFFPGSQAPAGFSVGGLLGVVGGFRHSGSGRMIHIVDGTEVEVGVQEFTQTTEVGAGVEIGYTFQLFRRLVLTLGAGGLFGVSSGSIFVETDPGGTGLPRFDVTSFNISPILHAELGLAF